MPFTVLLAPGGMASGVPAGCHSSNSQSAGRAHTCTMVEPDLVAQHATSERAGNRGLMLMHSIYIRTSAYFSVPRHRPFFADHPVTFA